MKKMLIVLLLAASCAGEGPAVPENADQVEMTQQAITSITSPYGNSAVRTVVGTADDGRPWLAFRRETDWACAFYLLSNTNALQDHLTVFLGTAADAFTNVGANYWLDCNNATYHFTALNHSASNWQVTCWAGAGGDWLQSDGRLASLQGQDGDDVLISNGQSNKLRGGNGNDRLKAIVAGSTQMFGEAGNDCLDSASTQPNFDCGFHTDQYRYPVSVPTCETTVSNCGI